MQGFEELHIKFKEIIMSNIHYFQRYHTEENVHTANAMLLLSRLYNYSPDKFYAFIETLISNDDKVDLEMQIEMQYKNGDVRTIPDAVIAQDSFKIVVETKLYNNFRLEQLQGHIDAFRDEHYKVLLTIDCEDLTDEIKNKIAELCKGKNIKHKHVTFASLIDNIREYIDDRDYDFIDILDDYAVYCDDNGLLPRNQFRIDMRLAGDTLEKNKELGLYYDGAGRGFSTCGYLGLYKNKSMRAIGKITKRCVVSVTNDDLNNPQIEIIKEEIGKINDKDKQKIIEAIVDAQNYEYNLARCPHRFFIVDKFYETDFKKISKYPPRGKRIFDISKILGIKDKELPEVDVIAEHLKEETWE